MAKARRTAKRKDHSIHAPMRASHHTTTVLLCLILLALIVLIALYSIKTYQQYALLKTHHSYFRQQDVTIAPWMAAGTVIRHFNISQDALLRELNITPAKSPLLNTTMVLRASLDSLCRKNHLNCTDVVRDLNALRTQALTQTGTQVGK